jgi:hypothetical protein
VPAKNPSITTLVDTTTPARQIDPAAPAGALVSALGLEREALRGHGWPSPPACSTR